MTNATDVQEEGEKAIVITRAFNAMRLALIRTRMQHLASL